MKPQQFSLLLMCKSFFLKLFPSLEENSSELCSKPNKQTLVCLKMKLLFHLEESQDVFTYSEKESNNVQNRTQKGGEKTKHADSALPPIWQDILPFNSRNWSVNQFFLHSNYHFRFPDWHSTRGVWWGPCLVRHWLTCSQMHKPKIQNKNLSFHFWRDLESLNYALISYVLFDNMPARKTKLFDIRSNLIFFEFV